MSAPDAGPAQQGNVQYKQLTPSQIAAMTADAQGWKPADGEELQGTVLAIKQGYSDIKNANYPIVFVMKDTGECVAVHCFQTVIENEMKQQRPLPGETLYIKHIGATGEAKKPGQSPVVKYAVHVQRDGSGNDPWEHMQS